MANRIKSSLVALFMVVLQLVSNLELSQASYDPESHLDGIPVINARSLAPSMQWRYDEKLDAIGQPSNPAQRFSTNSDADPEDVMEDDDDYDRDEYKSGSTNHDSYENPAFGESRRAAKDGDDIESFFDKHLGPQDFAESREDYEAPKTMKAEPDDKYEAAASSPLSTIFHTLLQAHKRPLVITTSEDSSTSSPSDSQTSSISSSAATPSIRGAYLDGSPIAYLAPMASHSSYESFGPISSDGGDTNQETDYAPVREIIISRRPTASLMSQIQTYAPSSQKLSHQSSNANWRALALGSRPGSYQDDYARYPVAATYDYRQEQVQPEEEQTVSFGLSFGRRPSDSADEEDPASGAVEEQGSSEGPAYAPYNARNLVRYVTPTPTKAFKTYSYVPAGYTQALQPASRVPFHPARYHKDPSESVAGQPANYGQYSGSSAPARDVKWATRQQLLANLDRQLKMNQYYRQNGPVEGSSREQADSKRHSIRQSMNQEPNEVNTYSSFHSEINPYRSYTEAARFVNEPVIQSGSIRMPSSVDMTEYLRTLGGVNSSQHQNNLTKLSIEPVLNAGVVEVDAQRNKAVQTSNRRVRREDPDDRENDDADDDGVWVDDDEDDDNRHSASDLNETSHEPEEEDNQNESVNNNGVNINSVQPMGPIHGYDLVPDDLMVYPG